MTDDDELIDPPEIAALELGVSLATLARGRKRLRKDPDADEVPFVQLSDNRVGYVRRDRRAYVAAHRVGRSAKAA